MANACNMPHAGCVAAWTYLDGMLLVLVHAK